MNKTQIAYFTRASSKDIEIIGTFEKSDTSEALIKNTETGKVLHVVGQESETGRLVVKVITDKKAKESFLESCATTKSSWKNGELVLGERGRKAGAKPATKAKDAKPAKKPKKAPTKKGKKASKSAEVDPLA